MFVRCPPGVSICPRVPGFTLRSLLLPTDQEPPGDLCIVVGGTAGAGMSRSSGQNGRTPKGEKVLSRSREFFAASTYSPWIVRSCNPLMSIPG